MHRCERIFVHNSGEGTHNAAQGRERSGACHVVTKQNSEKKKQKRKRNPEHKDNVRTIEKQTNKQESYQISKEK